MKKEQEVYPLSHENVPRMFEMRYTKFIRLEDKIVISTSNMTHAEAARWAFGDIDHIDDGGYLEATGAIFPVLIIRDHADTIPIKPKNIGYQRGDTIEIIEQNLLGFLLNASSIQIVTG